MTKEYIERGAAEKELLYAMVGTGYQSRAIDAITFMPAADVVEVVRCEKCSFYEEVEYYHPTEKASKTVCRLFKRQMQPNDFCSYGKKKNGRRESMKIYKNPFVSRESYFVKTGSAWTHRCEASASKGYSIDFIDGKWEVREAQYYNISLENELPIIAKNNVSIKSVIERAVLNAVLDLVGMAKMDGKVLPHTFLGKSQDGECGVEIMDGKGDCGEKG